MAGARVHSVRAGEASVIVIRRLVGRTAAVAALVALLLVTSGGAIGSVDAQESCGFMLGFRALRDQIPTVVGACVENEHHDARSGDGLQRTTAWHGAGGLLVWRKADNWTAFTDGRQTWINGPFGLAVRVNDACFAWEVCSGHLTRDVPVSADEVVRGDPSRPWMSLTFNAGAGYTPAPEILDTLRAKGVRTTFFLMGWWASTQPALVRRIAAEGHEIASHGHRVFDLRTVSDEDVRADLTRADAVISGITGRTTRPLWSASASARDARVNGIAAALGYRPIFWTLDSADWRADVTAEVVRRRVLGGAVNGAIIVMHLESPRTRDTVAPALPGLIDDLRARGFRLVTITELVTGRLSSPD
ncbi:MAG: hypothetical protein FJ033_09440 [Chloroflexi bacterium]|nr:hypothetical protein [Chloroflexota bacterium]